MKKVLSIFLCVLWMGFIFYNSSQNGMNSNGLSNKIVDKITTIYEKVQEEDSQNIKVYASPSSTQVIKASEGEGLSVKSIIKRIGSQDKVTLNKEIRKAAHTIEFLILAILLCNAFFTCGFKGRKAIVYILFIVLFYAVTDEFHQLYTIGRGSSVKDVLIDFVGGIIGTMGFYVVYYIGGKKRKKR